MRRGTHKRLLRPRRPLRLATKRDPRRMQGRRYFRIRRLRLCFRHGPDGASLMSVVAPSVASTYLTSITIQLRSTMSALLHRALEQSITVINDRRRFMHVDSFLKYVARPVSSIVQRAVPARVVDPVRRFARPDGPSSADKEQLGEVIARHVERFASSQVVKYALGVPGTAERRLAPRQLRQSRPGSLAPRMLLQSMKLGPGVVAVRSRLQRRPVSSVDMRRRMPGLQVHAKAPGSRFVDRSRQVTHRSHVRHLERHVRHSRIEVRKRDHRTTRTQFRQDVVRVEKRVQPVDVVYQKRQEVLPPQVQAPVPVVGTATPGVDVSELTDDVMRKMRKQMLIERERRGLL